MHTLFAESTVFAESAYALILQLYAHASLLISVCRADHHAGVTGKRRIPIQADKKALVTSPQTACCLVRSLQRNLLDCWFLKFCLRLQLF